jgi:hypothetical protein
LCLSVRCRSIRRRCRCYAAPVREDRCHSSKREYGKYRRLQAWEYGPTADARLRYVNDNERLRHDPATRWIVGGKAASGAAASPSQMGRFEIRWLTAERNLAALADLSRQWIDRVHGRRPPRGTVLDMDSSVSPTHGEQEMSVWNGHYECTCYHPLFVFNQFGDLERCSLRPGNVHSAHGWEAVLTPVVASASLKPLGSLPPCALAALR